MRVVASAQQDVVAGDVERRRAVFLLELAAEEAVMVVVPLQTAGNAADELVVRNVESRLVRGADVAVFDCRLRNRVEEPVSHEAGLFFMPATLYVQDEHVRWNFLVRIELDDVAYPQVSPGAYFEFFALSLE